LALSLSVAGAFGQSAGLPPAAPEAATAAASSASAPAFLGSVGSFFSRFQPTQPAGPQVEPSTAGSEESPKGPAFNPVDIDRWATASDVELDPGCKTLVQPFGVMDSAASLGMFAVKLKVHGLLGKLGGDTQAPTNPSQIIRLAARQLNWLPTELELRLGEFMVPDAEILPEDKNRRSRKLYAKARAVLADIVQDLPQPLPYEFRILVRTTSYGNASALPGGIILVDRDLFNGEASADYAYFVIAHEVAHVLQRHQTRAYQARLADGIDSLENLGKLLKNASSAGAGAVVVVPYASALKKLVVNFTEQQELQADSCAVRIMAKRFPDSAMMQAKLHAIERQIGPEVAAPTEGPKGSGLQAHLKYLGDGILERHPDGVQRRKNLHATFLTLGTAK
jgi:Zn-dependent protease with chaperone function